SIPKARRHPYKSVTLGGGRMATKPHLPILPRKTGPIIKPTFSHHSFQVTFHLCERNAVAGRYLRRGGGFLVWRSIVLWHLIFNWHEERNMNEPKADEIETALGGTLDDLIRFIENEAGEDVKDI